MAEDGSIAEELLKKINKHPYTPLPLHLPSEYVVPLSDFKRARLPSEHWIDMRKMKSKNRILPTGIFELFGNYCDESAYNVRRLLVKWLEKRTEEYAEYFSIPLKHKNLTMEGWMMQLNDDTQPGDELCIYALSRMFNRHVFIYTKHGYWSTHVFNVRAAETEIIKKCDITLVYAEPHVFGEIKRIIKPVRLPVSIRLDTSMIPPIATTPKTTEVMNFERKHPSNKFGKKRKRTDRSESENSIVRTLPPPPKRTLILATNSDTDTPTPNYKLRPRKKQETTRLNPRPARSTCSKVNYSTMDTDSERLSPPRKRKQVNLMRYPSATVISAHKRMMENSKKTGAIGAPQGVKKTADDVQTISDNKSPTNRETVAEDNTKSNNNSTPAKEPETATNSNNKITKSDNNNDDLMADTSTPQQQLETTNPQENDTNQQARNTTKPVPSTTNADIESIKGITTPEKIAIETLLNMGDSLEYDDPELEENALLMPVDRPPNIPIEPKGNIPTEPVNPEISQNSTTDPPTQSKGSDTDTTEIIEPAKLGNGADKEQKTTDFEKPSKSRNKKRNKAGNKYKRRYNTRTTQNANPEDNKATQKENKPAKKGKLTTKTFVLKRGQKPKRRFYCVVGKCKRICVTRKELNNHHRTAHPRILCNICKKLFDTPNSMHRHRYSHKKPKHFCADCGKGFFFMSELTSHRRCHLTIPGYSCFAKNCDKTYKREAELNAHVATHKKERIDCPVRTCPYFTYDRRNLRQHNRQHMPMKFECVYCYKKLRYFEQKKRHEPNCNSNPAKLSEKS